MKTVYIQGDAAALAVSGKAYRQKDLIFLTRIPEGSEVEVAGFNQPNNMTPVAVATDGKKVWLVDQKTIDQNFQTAKRPNVPKAKAAKGEPKK